MSAEKVLVITYYWPPSGGAGVQRALKFVKYFKDFGLEPVVLTVDPSAASYPVTDESLLKDVPAGITVHKTGSFEPLNILSKVAGKKHVPYGGFANANKESKTQLVLRWIRGNFFIPDARVGWVKHAYLKAREIIRREGIKYIMISSPPHSSQLIGLKLKKEFPELRWIADLRDPWTDIYYYKDLLHTSFAAAMDARYEKRVIENSDAILVVSESIKRDFLKKSDKVTASKVHVIPNGFDEDDFKEMSNPDPSHFTITYVGTMADTYKPEVFFGVMKKLSSQYPELGLQIKFVGNAPWTLKKKAEEMGLDKICSWSGHVSHEEAIRYMKSADMLLLIIPDTPGAKGILTGKLFEYLGAGKTILGIGPEDGDAAAILNECGAGRMFERSRESEMLQWLEAQITTRGSVSGISPDQGISSKYSRRSLTESVTKIIRAK